MHRCLFQVSFCDYVNRVYSTLPDHYVVNNTCGCWYVVRDAGRLRLSHRAFQAALFITLYRDQPALQEPFRLLELLMDIDESFTSWRHRHAQMALRMIGRRIGTGGSAGAKYLEKSAERSRVFSDLFSLSTFLVPRADRPILPAGILDAMRFRYEE